ncbi:uncharacterized protein [Clytia hemisphaerica]|uniref:Uncharacterized protein n=1 Tax=Clytia hemisphaerica TaxID=252671 RepID=A0A7M5WSF0_9CNID
MRVILIISLLLCFVKAKKLGKNNNDGGELLMTRNKAHEFLTSRSKRVRRDTSLEDECCLSEWCDLEEMEERHENNGFAKPQPYIIQWLRERPGCKYFYCDNGAHISMEKRCNLEINCANGEDEQDCPFNTIPTAEITGGNKGELIVAVNGKVFTHTKLNKDSSAVVAKTFGCSGVKSLRIHSSYIRELTMTLKCYGYEDNIKECKFSLSGDNYVDQVICYKESELMLKNQEQSIDGSVYGAAFISGLPICYQNNLKRNAAQVICNAIKDSSYVGVPYKVTGYTNNDKYFFTNIECDNPNYRLHQCKSSLDDVCYNMAGVMCLKEKTFKQSCTECPLQAMGAVVIATDINHEWSLRETNVFCRQEHATFYGGKYKYKLVNATVNATESANCLVSDIRCRGDESDLRKCDFQLLSKCPTTPFYQVSIECLASFKELIQIIQMVDTKTNNPQLQYNSVKMAMEKMIFEYGKWDCTGNITGEGIKAYCSTFTALRNLENILKPKKDESIIFLRTSHDIKKELSEKLLDERFSNLHTQISALGTRTTKFQLQLRKHLQGVSSFKASIIEAKINKDLLPEQRQLQMLYENKIKTLEAQLTRLRAYAGRVERAEEAEIILNIIIGTITIAIDLAIAVASAPVAAPVSVIELTAAGLKLANLMKEADKKTSEGKVKKEQRQYLWRKYNKLREITTRFRESRKAKQGGISEARKFLEDIESKKGKFNTESATRFLDKFGTMDAIIDSFDINEFGTTLNEMVGGLCNFIQDSSASGSKKVKKNEAREGLCIETSSTISSIITIMESTNDNGKTLSQILVELAQLKLEESSAAGLSITLESNLNSDLEVKLNQMLSIVVIKIQKRKLIEEACNMITYLNFGEEQDFCSKMKNDPEKSDLTSLQSYIHQDKCFSPVNLNVFIPVNNTQSLDFVPGFINSDALLLKTFNDSTWPTSGEILFDIPGDEWMSENGWIQKGDQGPFYLKQFEIFYPPQHPDGKTDYLVESNVELVKNKLNGKTYKFDQPMVYNLKYYDNYDHQLPCNGEIHAPYRSCPNDQSYSVCVSKKGNLPGPYYPTTNSTWRISMQSKYELPRIFSSTPFFLNAKIQICSRSIQDNRQKKKGYSLSNSKLQGCCPVDHYYDVKTKIKAAGQNPCKKCSSGTPRMGGYFCEKCPPGIKQTKDVYGCQVPVFGQLMASAAMKNLIDPLVMLSLLLIMFVF